jgi:hypothetical protein
MGRIIESGSIISDRNALSHPVEQIAFYDEVIESEVIESGAARKHQGDAQFVDELVEVGFYGVDAA